ncbi:hypothetical protein BGZ98_008565 [Dissophora globulifera]|nr:hypothetical protein BGZ98_008565 [Dissophora globulifera]
MQRANSNGIPFLRRQSTQAPPPVPYANPAATQFLRLGVGIDHVDVDQSDDEDVIYQGIENGMDGHDEDEDDEEEEDDSDNADEDEAGDINIALQHHHHKETNDDSMRTFEPMVAQTNDLPSPAPPTAATLRSPVATSYFDFKNVFNTSSAISPRQVSTVINTQFIPAEQRLRLDPVSPGSPRTPRTPLAPGLPAYHEKFSKASLRNIHGASQLSNINNTVIASSAPATDANPTAASRKSTAVHHLTETILTPGAENIPPVPIVKRFAEKEGFITIHGSKIRYKICYPSLDPAYRVNGNGRNIVLLHGALSNLGTWRKVQQTLADRTGCRVLSYDRVGHGLSDKPSAWPENANPYTNGGVLSISQKLYEALGMHQNLILIGNGTGATIASAIALSKLSAVRGLILIAPSILNESPPMYLRACVSYPPLLNWVYRRLYGDHGPLQQFYYKPKLIMADKATEDMYMRPAKDEDFWKGLTNSTKYQASYNIEQHLDRLTELSTLVITGDVDDIVPTMETLRLFEALQSARQVNVPQVLKIIKHAGHLPQEERPDDFVKVVSFFIRKVCLGSLSRERSLGRRTSGGVVRSEPAHVFGAVANNQSLTEANTQANANIPPHSDDARPLTAGSLQEMHADPLHAPGAPLGVNNAPAQVQKLQPPTLPVKGPIPQRPSPLEMKKSAPLPPLPNQQLIPSY